MDSWITIPSNQATFPALFNAHTPLNLNLESKLLLLIEANYRMFNVYKNINKCLVSLKLNLKLFILHSCD